MPDLLTIKEVIERYYRIRTKKGELKNLKFNSAQQIFYEKFKDAYNSNKPIRMIVLKARQLGISTLTEALITEMVTTNHNVNGLIVAHDSQSSAAIYSMTQLYYDELPIQMKPMVKYSNARLLTFDNPTQDPVEKEKNPGLRSSIRVSTAGSSGIARGSTFHYVHLSEIGFWDDTALKELTGILQSVPVAPKTLVVIESTANGFNSFKQLWDDAVSGRNDYIPVFIPWHILPEYRMKYDGVPLSAEEQDLKKRFNLDDDQIQWRRYKIRNDLHGSVDEFKQEFPMFPEEAFLLSGRPVFNLDSVMNALKSPFKAIKRGILNYCYENERISKWSFAEESSGPLWIYEMPVKDGSYVLCADTAGEGSDYFVAYVIKNDTGKIVAKYRMQTDEPLFTKEMYCLGRVYNNALICIEANFSSYPILELTRLGYDNQYVRESSIDSYKERYQDRFGFKTTALTRPIIIANLQNIVRENVEVLKDEDLLHEMLSFIYNDKGRPEGATGQHDDCVMCAAIGYYCRTQAPLTLKEEKIEETDDGYKSFVEYGG